VAAVQPRTHRDDEEKNVAIALQHIDKAADSGAKIILFPEGYPGPYFGPPKYSALGALSKKAKEREVYVIAGTVEKAESYEKFGVKNPFYLSSKLIGPKGKVIGTYNRVQPNLPEVDEFFMKEKTVVPGEELKVIKTEYGNLGFLICSEIWCTELPRVLALMGADIVFAPIGGAVYELTENWQVLLRARAIENHFYLVTCQNIWGMEDGMAAIYGPEETLAESKKPGIITANLDLDRLAWLRGAKQTMKLPKPYKSLPAPLSYRRPEMYKILSEPRSEARDFYYFKKSKSSKSS